MKPFAGPRRQFRAREGAGLLALVALVLTALAALPATPATSTGDGAVSVDSPYVKANRSPITPGDAIAFCGTDRRQQNEPTAAVDARDSTVVTSGSNDYCTVPGTGGTWAGFYRSTDSDQTWTDSLLPGYPTDTSPEGQASPLQQKGIANAGDPVQAWDLDGRLFFMGTPSTARHPRTGRCGLPPTTRTPRTTCAPSSSPTALRQSRASPRTRPRSRPTAARTVPTWATCTARSACSRATGTTRSSSSGPPIMVRRSGTRPGSRRTSPGNQFADIAVTSNGDVYIVWNGVVGNRAAGRDAMLYVKSTDGGKHFTKPRVAADFDGFDAADTSGSPAAAAQAHEQAYDNADGPESEVEPSSAGDSRDCGSGPFACLSGFTFFRHNSQPHITADPKGDPNTLWMVLDATVPTTEVASTSTYNTAPVAADATLRVGQGSIYLTKSTNGGQTWSPPTRLSPETTGHRLDTIGASSTDGGATWSETTLTSKTQQPNYEMFGGRRVPFHGDYNYVSSVDGFGYGTWTDTREVESGDDPRYVSGEGFDVLQCRDADGADQCPDGGLDQDIYGAGITP